MRFAIVVSLAVALLASAFSADPRERKVDQIFAVYNSSSSPGCAVGVMQDDDFIYRKGYGMGSLELGVPLSSESVFYMASVSKQFTAASMALAAEQGFLSLDDDVRKYIPELPDYGHVITLRQMLHHTSGFRDFETLMYLSRRDLADLHSKDEMLNLIIRQKGLNNVPGEKWIYSNTNYFLLAEVLERTTKKSLAEFAAENIFQPLGMVHTRYYDDHSLVVPGRVAAYDPGRSGKFLVDWSTNFEIVGPGGLMSNVDDMLLWEKNLDKNKLGKGTLLTEMQTRGVLNNGNETQYGLGLELATYRGLPTVGHDGALFGYRTGVIRFPAQHFAVVCLCNLSSADPSALLRAVADVYLEKSLHPDADEVPAVGNSSLPDPSLFAGKYLDPDNHIVYSFVVADGNLMAWGGKLRRVGPNQFNDLGTGTITFENSEGGMKATLLTDGGIFFAGNRVEAPHLSEADLAGFIGRYKSTEIETTYDLAIDQGGLLLRNNWSSPIKLTAVAPDEFESSDLGTFVFQRDTNRRVSGLSVFTVNARGVAFERVH